MVVFLDEVEIARLQTIPLYYGGLLFSCAPKATASEVGYGCYNFLYRIPRFADFDFDDPNNALANARLLQVNEQATFRSIDGRFLVVRVLQGQAPRNTLLLQPDDTIATPGANTPVPTPRFTSTVVAVSEQLTRTAPQTSSDNAPGSDTSLVSEWLRPFLISFLASLCIAVPVYIYFEKKRRQAAAVPTGKKTTNRVDSQLRSVDGPEIHSITVALVVQALGTVIGTIMLKVLGLA